VRERFARLLESGLMGGSAALHQPPVYRLRDQDRIIAADGDCGVLSSKVGNVAGCFPRGCALRAGCRIPYGHHYSLRRAMVD